MKIELHEWIRNVSPTEDDQIFAVDIRGSEFSAAYDSVGGTRIHERQRDRFASSHYQGRQYEEALEEILADANVNSAAIDVGCGDGRGMAWLIRFGCRPLIGVDVSAEALRRAKSLLRNPDCFFVHGGIMDLEIAPNAFDIVLAVESLHYLDDDYELGIRRISECVKPGGLVITSEPDWEAGLLYAALCGRMEELADLADQRRTYEHIDQSREVRSLHPLEKNAVFERYNLEEVARHGISALPLFLIHLYHQAGNQSLSAQTAIIKALDEVISHKTNFNRLYLTVHRKH